MSSFTTGSIVGAAAVAGVAVLYNSSVMEEPQKATLEYLSTVKLWTLDKEPREFLASELWLKNGAVVMAVRRPGCPLCRGEALSLSSLKPQLDTRSVPLYAVLHEAIGVEDFQPFFHGQIFWDKEKRLYGPVQRYMPLSGLLNLNVIKKFFQSKIKGDYKGEGRLLGGVFVMGSGQQGVLYEHREMEFGDYSDTAEVLEAAMMIERGGKS